MQGETEKWMNRDMENIEFPPSTYSGQVSTVTSISRAESVGGKEGENQQRNNTEWVELMWFFGQTPQALNLTQVHFTWNIQFH